MTFKHKLARRLAISRFSAPLAVALLAACAAGDSTAPTDTTEPADLARVEVSPKHLILETNQRVRFVAGAETTTGDSVAPDLEWVATGGTISVDGTYSAPVVGQFKVIGRGKGRKHPADTAIVEVVPPQPTLARVIVTPETATLTPGDSQVFTAQGKLSDSSVVAIGVKWSATGGTIDAGGKFVAGSTAGTYRVIVTNTAGKIADTAIVTIQAAPAAPESGTLKVDAKVHRLDGGSGTTLVSNGVPLPPGRLFASGLRNVRVLVNGQEKPLYVEALQGTHKDGSLRAVLVQFQADVPAATPVSATFEVGTPRTTTDRAKTAVTWAMPSAVLLPTSPDYLVGTGLFGPTITVAKQPTTGAFPTFDQKFRQFSDYHWEQQQGYWEKSNYYDRAMSHFVYWARSGNPLYWKRAAYLAYDYRTKYVEPNGPGSSPHWWQGEGLALHYWLTGDERSRTAVIKVSIKLTDGYPVAKMADPNYQWNEGRIQQRVLLTTLLSMRLNDNSRAWGQLAEGYVNGIVGLQKADGSFSWPNECGYQANFMVGLQNDALMKYYDTYKADPRIPQVVKKAIDYMWTTQWRAAEGGFYYYNGSCPNHGGLTPSPDLNQLIAPGFAWYYKVSGDATYRTRADEIFAQGVAKAYYHGSKQYNEQHYNSFNYLAYRQ